MHHYIIQAHTQCLHTTASQESVSQQADRAVAKAEATLCYLRRYGIIGATIQETEHTSFAVSLLDNSCLFWQLQLAILGKQPMIKQQG